MELVFVLIGWKSFFFLPDTCCNNRKEIFSFSTDADADTDADDVRSRDSDEAEAGVSKKTTFEKKKLLTILRWVSSKCGRRSSSFWRRCRWPPSQRRRRRRLSLRLEVVSLSPELTWWVPSLSNWTIWVPYAHHLVRYNLITWAFIS